MQSLVRKQVLSRLFSRRWASALRNANNHGDRCAVIDTNGKGWTFAELLLGASQLSATLANTHVGDNPMVLVLTEPGSAYVAATFAVWGYGMCSVPLCTAHTVAEMVYYANDSGSTVLLHDRENVARAAELCKLVPQLLPINASAIVDSSLDELGTTVCSPSFTLDPQDTAPATLIYTSGTTGDPKGAVHTHSSIQSQVNILVEAWEWTSKDHTLNCLPLHHLHGLVNVLLCSLSSGAVCEFIDLKTAGYNALYDKLADPEGANVFHAVPTIYAKLLACHQMKLVGEQLRWRRAVEAKFRLMVSGSMALPATLHTAWEEAAGLVLLERYGMTEIGMALSQKIRGERLMGSVGKALPSVQTRIVPLTAEGSLQPDSSPCNESLPFEEVGELLVKSPSMFKAYWNRPEATAAAFNEDGYFVTGDCVGRTSNGVFSILGRLSVDIIKSGGYKLSALEIESILLESPSIAEAAVLGVPDAVHGEVVSAALVQSPQASLSPADVRAHCGKKLAPYKIPRRFAFLDAIPRNAMGKINKKQLVRIFDKPAASA
ncbi:Malonate--CoA ligase [Diplonema papillatum]|nr:Malonate--CoA ligase [Diplonema papillatum]